MSAPSSLAWGAELVVALQARIKQGENLRRVGGGDDLGPTRGGRLVQQVEQVLAERGVTPAERTRVQQLVQTASRAPPMDAAAPAMKGEQAMERSLAAGLALHEWLAEWAAVARVAITKRSWLILMGLAPRRRADPATGDDETAAGDA